MKAAATVVGLLLIALAGAARAVESVESWSVAGTAGWTNESSGALLSNPGGYLDIRFNQQSIPALVEDRAWVELPPGVLLTNVQFQFRATETYPSALRIVLQSATNQHTWQVNLEAPAVGAWQPYAVPVAFSPAWFMGPENDAATFDQDLRQITRVAVYVRRHGLPGEQHYSLDDFTLQGLAIPAGDSDADGMPDDWETANSLNPGDPGDADGDGDGDGMSNYAEYRAGTNPWDADSHLALRIERGPEPPGTPVEGVVLRWNSISDRTYAVWRTLDLRATNFNPVATGVASTPPENALTAPAVTNAAFFRIEVEEP